MTTIGFIGGGYLGGTVARLAVAAGYDVVLEGRTEASWRWTATASSSDASARSVRPSPAS